MKLDEINNLFSRLRRFSDSLNVKQGPGSSWKYTFPDGVTTTYNFINIRPPEQIEDDAANLFIWIWNLKDHLKELATTYNLGPQIIEDAVSADEVLKVCADIANGLKHGNLRRSRSGKYPRLDRPHYEISQEAIGGIIFTADAITTNVTKPELVDISLSVKDRAGNIIGDAYVLLKEAIIKWERIYEQLIHQVPTAHNTAKNDAGKIRG